MRERPGIGTLRSVFHIIVSADSPSQAPSRIRHSVVLVTFFSAFILYLDRNCMGEIVKTDVFRADFGSDKDAIKNALSGFYLAYALFQVPAGWLSDRFGARGMMTFYIALWSICTLLMGMAASLGMIFAARLGLGIAQAGAYPTSGSLLGRWIPLAKRASANSLVAFGGRVGGSAANLLTAALVVYFAGWRTALILYGLAGLGIAAWFWRSFRDRPSEHPRCNAAERAQIAEGGTKLEEGQAARPRVSAGESLRELGGTLRGLVGSGSMWLMCIVGWGTNVGWVFLVVWLPSYLKDVQGLGDVKGGSLVTLVLSIGMLGMLLGGWVTDYSTRRFGLRWGRILPLSISRFAAALAYLGCLYFESVWMLIAAFALVSFATDFGTGAIWGFYQDVGGKQVGAVFGWANMWGNLGAAAAINYLPNVLLAWDANQDWHEAFIVGAIGFILAGVAALGLRADRQIAGTA